METTPDRPKTPMWEMNGDLCFLESDMETTYDTFLGFKAQKGLVALLTSSKTFSPFFLSSELSMRRLRVAGEERTDVVLHFLFVKDV